MKGLEDRGYINGRYARVASTLRRYAVPLRKAGESMQAVYAVPEGRATSSRLFAAWAKMQSRYPGWNEEPKNSIFPHLSALDLF